MKPSTPHTPNVRRDAGGVSTPSNAGQAKPEETKSDLSSPDWLFRAATRRYPTLTDGEFETLFHTYKTNPDPAARRNAEDRIILQHIRFILHWAHKNVRPNVRLLDLVQEGYRGARRALQKFEPKRGVKFITYANSWIRQAMQRFRQNSGRTVRIPIHLQGMENAIIATATRFLAEHGRLPDEMEIYQAPPIKGRKALATRFTETAVRDLWREGLLPQEWSFDAPNRNDTGASGILHHITPDPKDSPEMVTIRSQDTTLLHAAMDAYARRPGSGRSVALLRAYYLDEEGITYRELGERYGIARERVRQLMNEAMIRLRRIMAGLLHVRESTRPGPPIIPPSARQHSIFAIKQQIDPPQDGVLLFAGERWLNKEAIKRILGVQHEKLQRTAKNGSIRAIRYRATHAAGSPAFYAERDLQLVQDKRTRSRQRNPHTPTTNA